MVRPGVVSAVAPVLGNGGPETELLLGFACIGLLIGKELAATYPGVEREVSDALTAALVPVLGGFVAIVATHVS